jgi:hypothetical protein
VDAVPGAEKAQFSMLGTARHADIPEQTAEITLKTARNG